MFFYGISNFFTCTDRYCAFIYNDFKAQRRIFFKHLSKIISDLKNILKVSTAVTTLGSGKTKKNQ